MCPQPSINLNNAQMPSATDSALTGPQLVGTQILHVCSGSYLFSESKGPLNVYECQSDGTWTSNYAVQESCQSKTFSSIFNKIFRILSNEFETFDIFDRMRTNTVWKSSF